MEYNWNTSFDTAKDQMIHAFENGITVVTDFRLQLVHVAHNGDNINTFPLDEIENPDEYKEFLVNTAIQDANVAKI